MELSNEAENSFPLMDLSESREIESPRNSTSSQHDQQTNTRRSSTQAPSRNPSPPSQTAPKPKHAQVRSYLQGVPHFLALVLMTALLAVLIYWAARLNITGTKVDLNSSVIGGRMSQPMAKAIDFFCSTVLSPILFVFLDLYWFGIARVTVANEKSRAGIPLVSLAEAASTDSGTYNPYKIFKLLHHPKRKMVMFASLVLLSGVATAALSNIIAYESYTSSSNIAKTHLRSLGIVKAHAVSAGSDPFPSFAPTQQQQFGSQAIGLLTGLTYQNASDKLEDETYIGINATQYTMNSLPPSISSLVNVPGYRLSISCEARAPDLFGATQMGALTTVINSFFNITLNGTVRQEVNNGYYPGIYELMEDDFYSPFYYVGFPLNNSVAYLGTVIRYQYNTTSSPFGPVECREFI
jgi:hypothetical protein